MDYIPLLADLPIVIAAACLGALWITPTRTIWIWAALAYAMVDGAVTIAAPNPLHWHWNWLGKAASSALAVLIIRICRLERTETGMVLPRLGTNRCATFYGLATVVIAVVVNYVTRDHRVPTSGTLAYEATMPGLSEELAFRGLLIALFLRAYENREAAFIAAAAASVAIFGVGHGLAFDGSFHFAWIPAAYAAVLGALFIGMRRATGSILPGIVAHNLSNVLGDVANAM